MEQLDKKIKDANEDEGKREKYLKGLKQDPNFKEFVVEPIKEGMKKIQSVESIDISQDPQKVLSQIEAQKISFEYLTLLLSFFLDSE